MESEYESQQMQSEQIRLAIASEFIEVDSEDEVLEKESELPIPDMDHSASQTTKDGFFQTTSSLKRGNTGSSTEKNY